MSNGFLIHLSNTFLVSHQRPYPIYNSKRPTCHNSIQDHRSGNREDLTTNTKNLPLLLIFNCRCSNRVGKAGNRNKRTGTAPFGKQWINSGTGEKDTQKNEQNRSPAAAVIRGKFFQFTEMINTLSDQADRSTKEERLHHVEPHIVLWCFLFDIGFVLLLLLQLFYFVHK